jgi:hypothetical protein
LSAPFVFDTSSKNTDPLNPIADDNTSFSVYPNPSNGIFKVKIKSPDIYKTNQANTDKVFYHFDVVDVMGRVINSSDNISENEFALDLSTARPGIYFLRLSSNKNFKGCQRIVVSG